MLFYPYFTGKVAEAQRGYLTAKITVTALGLEPSQFSSRICAMNCLYFSDLTEFGEDSNCLKPFAGLTSVRGQMAIVNEIQRWEQ